MLDLGELPKNANGFRTTHTCELCGFEPKTKNKYREKQDHLVMKHFKERIDKIFPQSRPYTCPNGECEFTGKDKQALLRHYTGKHGVLELYLREALAAKGIEYHMSDNAKRKMNSDPAKRAAKEARLTPPAVAPAAGQTKLTHQDIVDMTAGGGVSPPLHHPHQHPHQQHQPTVSVIADTTTPLPAVTLPHHQHHHHHQQHHTTAAAAAPPPPQGGRLPSVSTVLTQTSVGGGSGLIEREVEAMLASFQPVDQQIVFSMPLPPQAVGGVQAITVDDMVSSTTPDSILPCPDPTSKLVVNDPGIMWGGGPAVMVEANQTVPVQYETSDPGFVNLGDIDYDYLYPATIETAAAVAATQVAAAVPGGQERQLTFSML